MWGLHNWSKSKLYSLGLGQTLDNDENGSGRDVGSKVSQKKKMTLVLLAKGKNGPKMFKGTGVCSGLF